MEFIIWFAVIFGLCVGLPLLVRSQRFQKLLVPKQPKQPKLEVPAKTLKQVHEEDHALWLAEYKAIFQKTCDHLYHHQHWYTCKMCGYEEPWVYAEGCSCKYEELSTLTDVHPHYVLIQRGSWCKVHGIDFKLFPVSDRKRGPYGTQGDSKDAVEKSRALTTGRSMRRIDSDIEGTH